MPSTAIPNRNFEDVYYTPTHYYTATLIRQVMAKFYYMTHKYYMKHSALTCPIIRDT